MSDCLCDLCTGRADQGEVLASGVERGRVGLRFYRVHWSYSTPGLPYWSPTGMEWSAGGFRSRVEQAFPPRRSWRRVVSGSVDGLPQQAAEKFPQFGAPIPRWIADQLERNEWWLCAPTVAVRQAEIEDRLAVMRSEAGREMPHA